MRPEQKQELERLNSAGLFNGGRLDIGFDFAMKVFFPGIAFMVLLVIIWPEIPYMILLIPFWVFPVSGPMVFKRLAKRRFCIDKKISASAYYEDHISGLVFFLVVITYALTGIFLLERFTHLNLGQSIVVMTIGSVPLLTLMAGKQIVYKLWKAAEKMEEEEEKGKVDDI
jgi:hypothetical protein